MYEYLLVTISVPRKLSKFERMHGCNWFFVIEKGPFIEWMAATRIAN